MKNATRRLLSLLLCLSMLLSMVPYGFAAETEETTIVTESAETEPAETEPAETEPAETEPVETEPAETEPAETEPAETESAETEPADTEPAETEPEETLPEETAAQEEPEVYAAVNSGTCGPNLFWTMDSYGNLTISGSGKMNDFRYPDVTPWDDLSVNSVVIKEGVTSIGYQAFSDCRYMLTIALPRSLTTINDNFYDCTWLSEIHYAGTPSEFEQINGKLSLEDKGRKQVIDWHFRSPGRNEYDYFPKLCGNNVAWSLDLKTSTLTISGTGEMWDRIRYNMWDFDASEAMRWKSPWNSIRDRITSVVITDGVTSVGANTFRGWNHLMNVDLPSSMTKIGDEAFSHCTLMSIPSFPSNLTDIGYQAFLNCYSLTNKVNLPRATYIGESAFDGCRSLPELTLSKPGVKIGKFAFGGCSSLKKVVLPEAASISNNAFSSCSALRELVIPNGVTKLGDSAFSYCTALKTVTLPRSLTDVGKSAFGACSALTDVYYQGSKKDRDGINIVQPNTEPGIRPVALCGCIDRSRLPSLQSLHPGAYLCQHAV